MLPALDNLGLKATFFADPTNLVGSFTAWQKVSRAGHELGNGFLWNMVDEDGLVPDWHGDTFRLEYEDCENLLAELCGNFPISFGMPCVRTSWGASGLPIIEEMVQDTIVRLNEEALRPLLEGKIVRSPLQGYNDTKGLRTEEIHSLAADGMNAEALCTATHIGISQGAWVVLSLNGSRHTVIDIADHVQFLEWLAGQRETIRIDTFGKTARLVASREDVRI